MNKQCCRGGCELSLARSWNPGVVLLITFSGNEVAPPAKNGTPKDVGNLSEGQFDGS